MSLDGGFDFSNAELDIERVRLLSTPQVVVRPSLHRQRHRLMLISAFRLELDRGLQKSGSFGLTELQFKLGLGFLIGKPEGTVLDDEFFDDRKLGALLREGGCQR